MLDVAGRKPRSHRLRATVSQYRYLSTGIAYPSIHPFVDPSIRRPSVPYWQTHIENRRVVRSHFDAHPQSQHASSGSLSVNPATSFQKKSQSSIGTWLKSLANHHWLIGEISRTHFEPPLASRPGHIMASAHRRTVNPSPKNLNPKNPSPKNPNPNNPRSARIDHRCSS
jgi:hypothetical protein